MQRRAAIWILGAFRTFPTEGLEAIADLIPIKLHLHKLTSRSQLRSAALPENHLIKTLIDDSPIHTLILPLIQPICLLIARKTPLKDTSWTHTTNYMEFSHHFSHSIQNSTQVLESSTSFKTDSHSI